MGLCRGRAGDRNTGDDCGNLDPQLDNLAEFDPRDEFSCELCCERPGYIIGPSASPHAVFDMLRVEPDRS